MTGHVGAVMALAHLEHERLASGGKDGTVRIWGLREGEAIAVFPERTLSRSLHAAAPPVALPALSPSVALCELAGRIASCHADGSLAIWAQGSGARDVRMLWPALRQVRGKAEQRAGPQSMLNLGPQHCVVGCADGGLRLWRDGAEAPLALWLGQEGEGEEAAVTALAVAGAGPAVAAPQRVRGFCFSAFGW